MTTLAYFRKYVMTNETENMNRGRLINVLLGIKSKWSYALRALLITSDVKTITKTYFLQKVDLIAKFPDNIDQILDFWNYKIYTLLKDY